MNPATAFTIGVLVGIAAVVWTGLALMWRHDRHASIRSAPVAPPTHRPVRVIRNTRPADPTRAEFDAIIARHTWPTQGGGE